MQLQAAQQEVEAVREEMAAKATALQEAEGRGGIQRNPLAIFCGVGAQARGGGMG